ncbi:MAG TPA: P22 phage major capsid protein family protein [Mycobacterium sp.]|jgi:hypothetical protein|nr:P22 phage major capsid protein family protein [Mycobacterium sp.]
MAVLTSGHISAVALELLTRSLVLPATATAIPGGEFAGSNGDTITVRVPQPGSARTQGSAGSTITYDDVTEIPVTVQLSHLYHGKLVSDEELSYKLEDFARQITRVQVAAVATAAEDKLATVMNNLTEDDEFAATATDADTIATILGAREQLSKNSAPADDRWLACSPEIITRLLSVEQFVKANEAGNDSALRNAIVGRIFGFTVVESAGLEAGSAVAYHRSGFAFANRVPVQPRGANDSSTASAGGIGLRHIFQYVPDKLSDASVVSTFAGAAAVYEDGTGSNGTDNKRWIKLGTAAS